MKIDTLVLGDFEANCYCVRTDGKQKQCLLMIRG